jgi:chromatin remodeling complex protein RSC6
MDLLKKLNENISFLESAVCAADAVVSHTNLEDSSNLKMFYLSSFRNHTFHFQKHPELKHSLLAENAGKSTTYSELCRFLRTYIVQHKLLDGGLIKCDAFLKSLCEKDCVTLFELLKHVKQIIL